MSKSRAGAAHAAGHEKWREIGTLRARRRRRVSTVKRNVFQIWCFFISRHSVVRLT